MTKTTKLLHFDEHALVQKLDHLPVAFRTAFAAASAQRLLPAYVRYSSLTGHGDQQELAEILARLWSDLDGLKTPAEIQQRDIDICMSLIPQEESDSWVPEQPYAEDAAAALAYALRTRKNGAAQEAAWAARRAYEAMDHFVTHNHEIDANATDSENKILAHPLIQTELARQDQDLKDLASNQQHLGRAVEHLRERAKIEFRAQIKPAAH